MFTVVFPVGPTEVVEDIPTVRKSIQQATSQASKLFSPFNQDHKKLEVSHGARAGGQHGYTL